MTYRTLVTTLFAAIFSIMSANGNNREKYNFNRDWLIALGDVPHGEKIDLDDSSWRRVTLPRAFNGEEAFRLSIEQLTDTISWYRKHFTVPDLKDRKVFVEFEGVRQGADFFLNGHHLGTHENGVMAVGFDLTPFMREGENVIAVRIDNNWDYHERGTATKFQWNDRNFNANYGGIPKNVYLHVTSPVYQTLPLYSNLATTGVYIYATDFDIENRKATVTAESQVKNETENPVTLTYRNSGVGATGICTMWTLS